MLGSLIYLVLLVSPLNYLITVSALCNHTTARQSVQRSAVESLFGQVAKTVVYGGATLASLNNRLLCTFLTRAAQDDDNGDEPTLFLFKSPVKRDQAFIIYSDDDVTPAMLQEAHLDANQSTVILVHGWLGGIHNEIWLSEAKNVGLRATDNMLDDAPAGVSPGGRDYMPNMIIVDWSQLAHGSLYTATRNSHKVARRLGRLIGQLTLVGQLRPELMHCLGHSIGAHICGQAARHAFPAQPQPAAGSSVQHQHQQQQHLAHLRRFGRITGLDPGGFCYELGVHNETTYLGLRPSDALLVDAYYSNRSPFGNKYQVAHYNVRLDNGFFQGACSVWRNATIATDYFRAALRFVLGNVAHNDILTCDHYFATRFAHQLPAGQCSYVAYACHSYADFVRGRCGQCDSSDQCYTMDFEYQRERASSAHALAHIAAHSSLVVAGQWRPDSPPGGVPYAHRRVYYMRVARAPPYCSYTYRVRVRLYAHRVDLRTLRADSIVVRLAGARTDSGEPAAGAAHSVSLHGPWLERAHGLDNRTLTGLFELARPEPISNFSVVYDGQANRGQSPLVSPIESVHFDYLSSADQETRSRLSSSFAADQVEVEFKHLAGALGVHTN